MGDGNGGSGAIEGTDKATCPELDSLRQEAPLDLGAGSGDSTYLWVLLQALGEVGLSSAWLRGTEWREVAQHLKGEVAERHGVSLWTGGVPQCWPPANRPWLLTPPVPPFPVLPRDQCPELPTWNTILQGTKPSGAGACVWACPAKSPEEHQQREQTARACGGGGGSLTAAPAPHTCGTHQVLTGPLRAGAFSQGISGTERPSNWSQVHSGRM